MSPTKPRLPIRPRRSAESSLASDRLDPLTRSPVIEDFYDDEFPPEVTTPIEQGFHTAAREREKIAEGLVLVKSWASPKWWWALALPFIAIGTWFMWNNAGLIARNIARAEIGVVAEKVDGVVGKADEAVKVAVAAGTKVESFKSAIQEIAVTAGDSATLSTRVASELNVISESTDANEASIENIRKSHNDLQEEVAKQLLALGESQNKIRETVEEIRSSLDQIPGSEALALLRNDIDALIELQSRHTSHLRRVETALARHIQGKTVRIERPASR